MDLNADLGEGFGIWRLGDDMALLDVVSSANVACGFHAGDPVTMRRICASAARRGVAIGAQVGYHDLAGFGRRLIDISADDLTADVLYQIGALSGFATAAGTAVRYVKPHGALYGAAAQDPLQAGAIAEAVAAFDRSLPLLGLADSRLADAAVGYGLEFVAEAFADRAYLPSGRLVPRDQAGGVITDPGVVAARAVRFAREGRVVAIDGTDLAAPARSICLHGDTPGAAELARSVRAALTEAGIDVAAFVE
ncbi:MAG: LamB/YcsF family protein [Actinomycetota bacterium]|nr:LamB/YcsF family protein [Actinomycetota bacterium]